MFCVFFFFLRVDQHKVADDCSLFKNLNVTSLACILSATLWIYFHWVPRKTNDFIGLLLISQGTLCIINRKITILSQLRATLLRKVHNGIPLGKSLCKCSNQPAHYCQLREAQLAFNSPAYSSDLKYTELKWNNSSLTQLTLIVL